MKRDMELVRQILCKLEEIDSENDPGRITVDGYTDEQVGYHSHIMWEAGLIHAADASAMRDAVPQAIPLWLTWEGHEFLDAARADTRWKNALGMMQKLGGSVPLQVLQGILTKLLMSEVDTLMG